MSTIGNNDAISIYIHIPFCITKCPYCPFYSIPYSQQLKNAYLGALNREWQYNLELIKNTPIVSLYFGGGTPSVLPIADLKSLIDLINPPKETEITLEINPDDVTQQMSSAIKDIGINRVSVGVQSLQENELQLLQRRHTAKKALQSIDLLHNSEINNISIDLMYGIPHQTIRSWSDTLKKALKLPFNHISVYDLSLETNTPFYRNRQHLKLSNEKELLHMHKVLLETLEKEGFKRYEIASFAKNAKISLHNFGYWTGRQYLGLGPGASSYIQGIRRHNIADINHYLKKSPLPLSYTEEKLPYPQNIQEKVAIGLRIIEGIDLSSIPLTTNTQLTLESLKNEGLLQVKGNKWSLTQKGLLFYDEVAERII